MNIDCLSSKQQTILITSSPQPCCTPSCSLMQHITQLANELILLEHKWVVLDSTVKTVYNISREISEM